MECDSTGRLCAEPPGEVSVYLAGAIDTSIASVQVMSTLSPTFT